MTDKKEQPPSGGNSLTMFAVILVVTVLGLLMLRAFGLR